MASRLLRRLRRNAGSVASVLVRDVLLRGKNLLGLAGVAVGLTALLQGAGALLAGSLVSTAVFGLVGGAALYGATESFLGSPLKGAGVFLAGLLLVGGGAHALGVGPADTDTGEVTDGADVTFYGPESHPPPEWNDDDRTADESSHGADDHGSGHGWSCGAPTR